MLEATGVELPRLETVVVARGGRRGRAVSWEAFVGRATSDSQIEADRRGGAVRGSDPSDILFTSGTTGFPKGVVMTHDRTLCVAIDWAGMVNPYFHMFGLKAGVLACIASGAVMLPEPVFDVDRALMRVAQEHVTVFPGPPTLYQAILDNPRRGDWDLSSLRVAVTGASDIPVELIRRIFDELPFSTVMVGYGLTEGGNGDRNLTG